ncbi:hypothetical protein BLNAU_23311 [Blattamonas nauphoetae]|uniref:Uncharacterized protein n=1 Tax=Blattamonas nauphoetae TaxID=2049346 RepID=A0ABQ9WR17_9EUKA|nr:hypothetical protein BLNAU_23311 [Blattamonas nauphoetae]
MINVLIHPPLDDIGQHWTLRSNSFFEFTSIASYQILNVTIRATDHGINSSQCKKAAQTRCRMPSYLKRNDRHSSN